MDIVIILLIWLLVMMDLVIIILTVEDIGLMNLHLVYFLILFLFLVKIML